MELFLGGVPWEKSYALSVNVLDVFDGVDSFLFQHFVGACSEGEGFFDFGEFNKLEFIIEVEQELGR